MESVNLRGSPTSKFNCPLLRWCRRRSCGEAAVPSMHGGHTFKNKIALRCRGLSLSLPLTFPITLFFSHTHPKKQRRCRVKYDPVNRQIKSYAGIPLCSYVIACGRVCGFTSSEVFNKSLCNPLSGCRVKHNHLQSYGVVGTPVCPYGIAYRRRSIPLKGGITLHRTAVQGEVCSGRPARSRPLPYP